MKTTLTALAALLLSASVCAADTYTLDPTHTYPNFEINHLGLSTQRGHFNKTTGKITLDLEAKKASVNATIDATSLDTGLAARDKHLKGPDFFNVEKFPTATFKSDSFSFDGNAPASADGTLTLLGVTKPVKLTIANFKCIAHPMNKKPVCAADVSTTIKRSEWGMSAYVPAVADEVLIKISVEAFKE